MRRTRPSHEDLRGAGTGPAESDSSKPGAANPPDKFVANHNQRIRDPSGEGKIPHAILRARERYGLNLSLTDLWNISEQCKLGYGRMKIHPGGAEKHVVFIHGMELLVVWWPPTYGAHPKPDGVVATVLPREAVRAMHKKHKGAKIKPEPLIPKKKPRDKLERRLMFRKK